MRYAVPQKWSTRFAQNVPVAQNFSRSKSGAYIYPLFRGIVNKVNRAIGSFFDQVQFLA
jgi:hypothetical protein